MKPTPPHANRLTKYGRYRRMDLYRHRSTGGDHLRGAYGRGAVEINHNSDIGVVHTPLRGLRSPRHTLGAIVRGFKAASTRRINEMRLTPGVSVWQRNYYEHVIRNEGDLERVREYILSNPYSQADETVFTPGRAGKDKN